MNFAQFEHEGWERVATKYENAWSGLTRLFIGSLLDATQVESGQRLLDVACGPGYVGAAAAENGAVVTGLDFCAEMVRLAKLRNPQLEFREGDAQALPFPDEHFDRVVMNFGLLHLAHPEIALMECCRVLRAGGRFAFTVWAAPDISMGANLVETAIRRHATMDMQLPQGPDYFAYSNEHDAAAALESAGFNRDTVVFKTKTFAWQVPTASFIFNSERDAGVRTAALLRAQTPEVLAAIERDLADAIESFAVSDGYAVPYAAHVVAIDK